MNKKLLHKYLRGRGVSGPWQLEGEAGGGFRAAVVVPALAERDSLQELLSALSRNDSVSLRQALVVVVVNNRASASAAEKDDNQRTLTWLRSSSGSALKLAWVDAASPDLELGAKEGVGLARKIGFDLALQLLDWKCDPLLLSLDADTLVRPDYLAAVTGHFRRSESGAAVIPFRHRPAGDSAQERAIRHYELYLRSYLFGLRYAASPYAYHVLGSAFACRATAYLKAGGMNRRLAGEDFYFLQQLAKTTGIEMLSGTVVQPSARYSQRVPFGTGRAVQAKVGDQQVYRFVSAAAFDRLKQLLALVEQVIDSPAEEVLSRLTAIDAGTADFFTSLQVNDVWQKLQANHATTAKRLAAFHQWFDALRTRQLLTAIDSGGPNDDIAAVAELLELGGFPGIVKAQEQLALLERLQGVSTEDTETTE